MRTVRYASPLPRLGVPYSTDCTKPPRPRVMRIAFDVAFDSPSRLDTRSRIEACTSVSRVGLTGRAMLPARSVSDNGFEGRFGVSGANWADITVARFERSTPPPPPADFA